MSDRIRIEGIRARGILGVHAAERLRPRPVVVDVELETDLARPGRSDRIEDAVDYAAVAESVKRTVAASRFRLLERLAEEIASAILRSFAAVGAAAVRARKPGAVPGTRDVSVEIRRAAPARRSRRRRRPGRSPSR